MYAYMLRVRPHQALSTLKHVSSRQPCYRLVRWQSAAAAQAAATDGPAKTDTNRAETSMKRFWKDVGIAERKSGSGDGGGESALAVTLDGRPLKTPGGKTLLVPRTRSLLATLIVAEWDAQETLLKPHALPMTSIASRALDGFADEESRAEVRKGLLDYLDTDTICFHQEEPEQLVRLQQEHWDPLLRWVRETFGVDIRTTGSILFSEQPEATREKLDEVLRGLDQWELAALERVTHITKSLLIALALVKRHLTVEQASLAALVEVNSQIERWGEVEDTHDVDYRDVRRQVGSAACLLSNL